MAELTIYSILLVIQSLGRDFTRVLLLLLLPLLLLS